MIRWQWWPQSHVWWVAGWRLGWQGTWPCVASLSRPAWGSSHGGSHRLPKTAREAKTSVSAFKASACITFANDPLVKVSHGQTGFQVWGNRLHLLMAKGELVATFCNYVRFMYNRPVPSTPFPFPLLHAWAASLLLNLHLLISGYVAGVFTIAAFINP